MIRKLIILFMLLFVGIGGSYSCSIVYYIDPVTGKIYAANNEDYWYNVKPYLKIEPATNKKLARLWYGWNNFAQGGINEAGLFFDGASTPEQKLATGYSKPKGNLGDDILATCKNVDEVLDYLTAKRIALTDGHLLFGDKTGNAIVIEWVNGIRKTIPIKDNKLMITNFLLSDTAGGNYPCPRYNAMESAIEKLRTGTEHIGLKEVGNIAGKAVQLPFTNDKGKTGGTLYTTFINITDMEFVLIYKLDNSKITKLDLKTEFAKGKSSLIKME